MDPGKAGLVPVEGPAQDVRGLDRRRAQAAAVTPGRVRRRGAALAAPTGALPSVAGSAAQSPAPAASWCDRPPRQGYESLERTRVSSPWFSVYRVEPGVYAVYEPHQFQEVISYLILGSKQALLFDTGMGMAGLRPLIGGLTRLPVVVLHSHTHHDPIRRDTQGSSHPAR